MTAAEIRVVIEKHIKHDKMQLICSDLEKAIRDSFDPAKIKLQKSCLKCKNFSPWLDTVHGFCDKRKSVKNENETCKMWEAVTANDFFTCRVCLYFQKDEARTSYCQKHNKLKRQSSKCKDFTHPF